MDKNTDEPEICNFSWVFVEKKVCVTSTANPTRPP